MRCEHFPLFTYGNIRAHSECPASRQTDSYVGGVLTASSLAIGSTCTKGTRYSYVDRVFLTLHLSNFRSYKKTRLQNKLLKLHMCELNSTVGGRFWFGPRQKG